MEWHRIPAWIQQFSETPTDTMTCMPVSSEKIQHFFWSGGSQAYCGSKVCVQCAFANGECKAAGQGSPWLSLAFFLSHAWEWQWAKGCSWGILQSKIGEDPIQTTWCVMHRWLLIHSTFVECTMLCLGVCQGTCYKPWTATIWRDLVRKNVVAVAIDILDSPELGLPCFYVHSAPLVYSCVKLW